MNSWISVKDRLPKEEIPVLVAHNGVVKIGERRWEEPTHEDFYQAFWYWDDPNNDGQDWEVPDVTHWMEIPLPPEYQPVEAKQGVADSVDDSRYWDLREWGP